SAAQQKIGGEELIASSKYWQALNEQQLDFFQTSENLWRLSVPPATEKLDLEGEWFYDWGGAQRWLKSNAAAEKIFAAAVAADGHATLFKSETKQENRFTPLSGHLLKLQQNLKSAFDPYLIFNSQVGYTETRLLVAYET
ncbi:MAG: glycolate oxidase subunit GlcE, partial [Methylococcaceae bacterium]|nr:glycolate oxidase subunit GlcE [Methylococcaceae bacterium]